MKHTTKLKIIYRIKKLLRYNETKDFHPIIPVRIDKMKLIRSQQMYKKQEVSLFSEDQIKYHANLQLISELEKLGAIEYAIRDCDPDNFESCIYEARVKVIVP